MTGVKAQVLAGSFGEIIARQKSEEEVEIGELLICKEGSENILMQVTDVYIGSQISSLNLEKISGLKLEEGSEEKLFNEKHRVYNLLKLKPLIRIKSGKPTPSKKMPEVFSKLEVPGKEDLNFMEGRGVELGKLRSGAGTLDVSVKVEEQKLLKHHIFVTGSTGKGKSTFMKNLLWSITEKDKAASLVLDPHDEYYDFEGKGLKDHPEGVLYYTQDEKPGSKTLVFNLELLRPNHFDFLDLSGPQRQIMYIFYKKHREKWLEELLTTENIEGDKEINEMSLAVLKRRLRLILDLDVSNGLECNGCFDKEKGRNTSRDIVKALEDAKTVIIDTSGQPGEGELLIASLLATDIFSKYKYYNSKKILEDKPVVTIVLEEAPRVLGAEVLKNGSNIFSSLAREGRKFKIGLTAMTQLPSLIPKEVLANMNTKVILGTEMNSERQALIESASQDLSGDSKSIASLDKGEAIVTSNFTDFAVPLRIEEFKVKKERKSFDGVKL